MLKPNVRLCQRAGDRFANGRWFDQRLWDRDSGLWNQRFGEPDVRELEPDLGLAAATGGYSRRGVNTRDDPGDFP